LTKFSNQIHNVMKNSYKIILLAVILIAAFSFSSRGQTPVSGGIYANTTWTLANSPYVVTGNVVVFPGYVLTIQPGVTVKFDNGMQIEIRQSQLFALGTINDSITFTSNSSTPTIGCYSGILLTDCSQTQQFNYCNFLYSNHPLASQGSNTFFPKISNSNFRYNLSGLVMDVDIDSCNFSYNTKGIGGISGFGLGDINFCSFTNNQFGIAQSQGTNITNCNFSGNQYGLFISSNMTNVQNCVISNNSKAGVVFNGGGYTVIKQCQINNNGIGIYDSSGYSVNNTINMNIIEYNTIGIKLKDIDNNIYCNKICSNTFYDLYYKASSNSSFINNDWCSTDIPTIASHIYDGYDNISLGLVNFIPFDTVQCYLTGCLLNVTASVINATCDTCHNGSATAHVTNGTAPYTYTWYTSPLQTTQTATGLAPGTYTVCVVDNNGCSICDSNIYIDSTNCNGFSISTHGVNSTCSICNDGNAWVNSFGGTPPYSYSWYTGPMQNTDTAFNLLPGTYGVCVTDQYGCALCDSVTISTGSCSAHFDLYPDISIPHQYYAVNMASGVPPISYAWNFGDGSTSTLAYPTHTYAVAGFYGICLYITDGVGCTNTYCNNYYLQKSENAMVTINVVAPSGISENSNNQGFSINPNPASDFITITSTKKDHATIKVYNLLGELQSTTTTSQANTNIDISKLEAGVYIIEVVTDKNSYRQKFIKE